MYDNPFPFELLELQPYLLYVLIISSLCLCVYPLSIDACSWADDNSCTYQIAAAKMTKILMGRETSHWHAHKKYESQQERARNKTSPLRGPKLNFRHEVDLKFDFAILANIHKRSRKSNFVPKVQLRANPIFGLTDPPFTPANSSPLLLLS